MRKALFSSLEASTWSSRALRGALGALQGPTWAILGRSWEPLGALLGALGALLGRFRGSRERFCRDVFLQYDAFKCQEPNLDDLGAIWRRFGSDFSWDFGLIWCVLRATCTRTACDLRTSCKRIASDLRPACERFTNNLQGRRAHYSDRRSNASLIYESVVEVLLRNRRLSVCMRRGSTRRAFTSHHVSVCLRLGSTRVFASQRLCICQRLALVDA